MFSLRHIWYCAVIKCIEMKPMVAIPLFMLIGTFTYVHSDPNPKPDPEANPDPNPDPDPQLISLNPYVPHNYNIEEDLDGKVFGVLVSAAAFKALTTRINTLTNQFQQSLNNLQQMITSLRNTVASNANRITALCTCYNTNLVTALANLTQPITLAPCLCT
ncbi:hypothetical protein Anas_05011 [Armadillidium nasatum]|uniref:Uncharacterized protein n=1 Tax=Armadillidium nasatum TaxID=96803 RepID=A0A5N5SN22_9CRUS|nr:hypothetical protein Anas_05011 [Armadillidium nasatum]